MFAQTCPTRPPNLSDAADHRAPPRRVAHNQTILDQAAADPVLATPLAAVSKFEEDLALHGQKSTGCRIRMDAEKCVQVDAQCRRYAVIGHSAASARARVTQR